MAFIIALLIFASGLTGVLAYLMRKAYMKPSESKSDFALSNLQHHYSLISVIHITLLAAFICISILIALSTARPYYYFGMEAALFASGLLIAALRGPRKREYILVLTIAVVTVSNFATVTIGNGFIPVSTDGYRDILIANSIASGSEFREVQLLASRYSGYYALIPALPTSLEMLSSVTGLQQYLSFPILGGATSFAFVLGTYLAIRKFTADILPAWIVAFIALSTPRLVSIYTIPEWVSMAIISAAFMILFIRLSKKTLEKNDIKYFGLMIFLLIASLIYHPNGAVTILVFLGCLILAAQVALRTQLNYKIGLLSIICIFVALTYWSYNDFALSTITNTNTRLFNTFLAEYGKSSYTPPNLTSDEDIFALAWALPVAISSAFLLVFMRRLTLEQSERFGPNRILICQGAAIVVLPLTLIGFLSFIVAPSAAVERYISVTTYFLMLIPASLLAGPILRSMKAPFFVSMIILLSVSVAVGSYSPEFAPNEHRSFEAARPTLDGYLELSPIQYHFPIHSYVYADNDVPLVSYLESPTLTIQHPISFQKTRNTLEQLGSGHLVLFDAIGGKITIFMIRSDRMEVDPSAYTELNLIGSTGNHMIFVVERR